MENFTFTQEIIEEFQPKIVLYNHPILRKKALPINFEELPSNFPVLIEKISEFMIKVRGAGIAAPQVGISARFFLLDMNLKENNAPPDIRVFLNPELSEPTKTVWMESEGCLSIPGIRVDIQRPEGITVRYQGIDGKFYEETHDGWIARGLMHENDHLNGVLHIDRISPQQKKRIAPLLANLIKKQQ